MCVYEILYMCLFYPFASLTLLWNITIFNSVKHHKLRIYIYRIYIYITVYYIYYSILYIYVCV
jgi:hypothetical protein